MHQIPTIKLQQCAQYSKYWLSIERFFQSAWPDFKFCDSYTPEVQLPPVIIALANEQLIGGLAYSDFKAPFSDEKVIWINALYVDPIWRNNTVASQLLQQAIVQMPKGRQDHLYAYTNVPALYASLGWSALNIESEPDHKVMAIKLEE